MAETAITPIRGNNPSNHAAIVFIHGFTGSGSGTWSDLAPRILNDSRLSSWDGWSVTYGTSWLPDIKGIWSADADLDILAQKLATDLKEASLKRYKALVLIAHSMGGLVAQKALVDSRNVSAKTHAVILFGTPSAGLAKARVIWPWKRQLADMAKGGDFIKNLRADWSDKFATDAGFSFLAVAGEKDQFVPPDASLKPFPREQCAVIAGNHVTMIHPAESDPSVVDLVVNRIVAKGDAINESSSAKVAIERGEFRSVVRDLEPHVDELDDRALVDLAIALDALGKRERARQILESTSDFGPDVLGTLGGRLKRMWLFSGRRKRDAEAAEARYAQGLQMAKEIGDPRQAYYHGINLAFLALVFRSDRTRAKKFAREVLKICSECRKAGDGDEWLAATEGEAHLILGETEMAIAAYKSFVGADNNPWKLSSTYLNAQAIAAAQGNRALAKKLDEVFGDSDRPVTLTE